MENSVNFIIGMDVSTLIDSEEDGAAYYDNGKRGELLSILKKYGVNGVRIRLWNDPYDENGVSYGAGTCDLPRVLRLAARVKAMGMHFLLDFHYSDFWADPTKQFPPKAWRGLSFEALLQAIEGFSRDTLLKMKEADCLPDMIQVGNEITNGMLFPYGGLIRKEGGGSDGYENLCALLKSAISGIKEVTDCPLMIHLERSYDNAHYRDFFDNLVNYGVRFDAIGLSYYPYWHHGLDELKANLNDLSARYGKELYIAETSYAFTTERFEKEARPLVIDGNFKPEAGRTMLCPFTKEGQADYCRRFYDFALKEGCKGVYWWEPAWIPTPHGTWASAGARRYMGVPQESGGNEWANQCLFDYGGNALPALEQIRIFSKKIEKNAKLS